MIDSAGLCPSKHRHEQQGRRAAPLAATLALAPRPVASWRTQERFRPRQAPPRARQLAPFPAPLVRMREQDPSSAAQGLPHLRAQGCAGGASRVKASVRPGRPTRHAALLPLACAPGACAQGDGGSCGAVNVGQTSRRLRCVVIVLGSSRWMSVECTVSQTMEHFWACHQHACASFGAVPPTVRVDHRTSAVRRRARGEAPVRNPPSADGAAHDGLRIVPGTVGQGHAKGRVAHGVGSVKKQGLAGLARADCSVGNPAAQQWLSRVAQRRVPGDTRHNPRAVAHGTALSEPLAAAALC
jgi:transposase